MEERQVRRIVAHRRADQAVAIEHIEIKMRVLLGVPVVRFTFGDTQMVEGKRPIYGPYVTKEKQTQIKIPVSQDQEMRNLPIARTASMRTSSVLFGMEFPVMSLATSTLEFQ